MDLHMQGKKLNREMAVPQTNITDNIKKVDQYVSDVVSGKIALDGLKRLNDLNERMAEGDKEAGIELAMEFMPLGITKLLPIKGLGSTKERVAAAKEQGFFTGMPLYHGTDKDITEFKLPKTQAEAASGSPVGTLGVSLAESPSVAGEFANLKGSTNGPNILPVIHRAEKPTSIALEGGEMDHEIAATVLDAWDQGFDSIRFTNYTTPKGIKGQDFILVKDPNQVRSVSAAFDLKKKMSPDILAGITGATVMAGATTIEDETN